MVALRRFHHQFHPDVVEYEAGAFSEAEVAALEALGHHLKLGTRGYGNMNVVTWDYATGRVDAASDPRSAGEAQVY
jgi:gamma-glutamyltranspeptidase/glutathione hydrolase